MPSYILIIWAVAWNTLKVAWGKTFFYLTLSWICFFIVGNHESCRKSVVHLGVECTMVVWRDESMSCTLPGCSRSAEVSTGSVLSVECRVNSVPKENSGTSTSSHLSTCFLSLLFLCMLTLTHTEILTVLISAFFCITHLSLTQSRFISVSVRSCLCNGGSEYKNYNLWSNAVSSSMASLQQWQYKEWTVDRVTSP